MKNIKIKGSKNIRDLGIINSEKVKIKENMLFRGSSLDKLTKNDVKIITDKYRINTIIDLRTKGELMKRPDVIMTDITTIHLPIFNEKVPGITHEGRKELDTKNNIDMKKMYREIMIHYLDKIGEIIKTIINLDEKDYPVIYHCTEGKDRTGIITAIILMILGVEKDKIIEDYLYTNKVNRKKAIIAYLNLKYFYGDRKQAEKTKNVFLAKEEYIEEVFDVIDDKWNGIDNFIKNGLKLSKKEIDNFKNIILVKD